MRRPERPDPLRVLEQLAEGRISASLARQKMYGVKMSNPTAELIKSGVWAVEGGYPTGDDGARQAARDALAEAGTK